MRPDAPKPCCPPKKTPAPPRTVQRWLGCHAIPTRGAKLFVSVLTSARCDQLSPNSPAVIVWP